MFYFLNRCGDIQSESTLQSEFGRIEIICIQYVPMVHLDYRSHVLH